MDVIYKGMITDRQQLLLKQYQERSYFLSILAEELYNYYNFIKNVINIPLIICNSVMVFINSTMTDQELLKIMNIILNSSTGLILSFVSSFKIHEHNSTHPTISPITNEIYKIDTFNR